MPLSWIGALGAGAGLLNSIFGGGGGGGGGSSGGGSYTTSPLMQLIASGLVSQDVPNQTTPGTFTPQQGSFGSYNYIPTGGASTDQALQQMLGGLSTTNSDLMNMVGGAGSVNENILTNALSGAGVSGFADSSIGGSDILGNNIGTLLGYGNTLGSLAGSVASGYGNVLGALSNQSPQVQSMLAGINPIAQQAGQAGQNATSLGSNLLSMIQNPYASQAIGGAQTAGGMMTGAAMPQYMQGLQYGNAVAGGIPAAQQVLNTAMDPQTALYNQTAQQTMDQINNYLAQSGLTSSGAGAGIASNALSNFNIDWQNNQLARQTQGLGAYNSALNSIGSQLGQGQGLTSGAAGSYAQGAGLPSSAYNQQLASQLSNLGTGTNAVTGGLNLQTTANALPYNTLLSTINPYESALQQYASALPQIGGAYANAGNFINQAANAAYQSGAIPYQTNQTINNNQMSALTNFLSNQQAGLQNQTSAMSPLQAYLNSVMQGSNNASSALSRILGPLSQSNTAATNMLGGAISQGLGALGSLFNQPNYNVGQSPTSQGANYGSLYTGTPSFAGSGSNANYGNLYTGDLSFAGS